MAQSSTKKFKLSSLAGIFIEVLGHDDDDHETKGNSCSRGQDASSSPAQVTLKSSSLLHPSEPQVVVDICKEDASHKIKVIKCESPEVVIIGEWMKNGANIEDNNDSRMEQLWRRRNEFQGDFTPKRNRNRRFPNKSLLGHTEQAKGMKKNQISGLTAADSYTYASKSCVMNMQKKWNAKKGKRLRRLSAYQDILRRYTCHKCHKHFLRFQDMWKHRVNLCGLVCPQFCSIASEEFHAQDRNINNRVENFVFRVPSVPPNSKQVTEKVISCVLGSSLLEKPKMGSDSASSCDTEEDADGRFLCRYPGCRAVFDQSSELHTHIVQVHLLYACKYCESLVTTRELLNLHLLRKHPALTGVKDREVSEFEAPPEVRQSHPSSSNQLKRRSTIKRPRSSEGKTHARTKTSRQSRLKETNEFENSGPGPVNLNRGAVVDEREPPKIQETVEKFRHVSENLGLCTDMRKGYQCNQCPMDFSRDSSLKSHMKTHHGDGKSDASNISVVSSVSSSLLESSSEVEEPGPRHLMSLRTRSIPKVSSFSEISSAGSTTTNSSISSSPGLSRGAVQHRTTKRLTKESSPDSFDLNLRNGSVPVRDNAPFVATPPKLSRQDDLRTLSVCNDCGDNFSGQDELKAHLLWHNEMKGKHKIFRGLRKTGTAGSAVKYPDVTSKPDPLIKCIVCGGGFYNYQAMKDHIKTKHTRNGQFRCMDCGKVFVQAMVLLTHCELKHNLRPPQLEKVESESNPLPKMTSPAKLPQGQGHAKTDIRKNTTPIKLVQKPTAVVTRNKPTNFRLPDQSVDGLASKKLATKSARSQGKKNQASREISLARSLQHPCKYIDCGQRFERIEELREHFSAHSAKMKFFCSHPNCGYPNASMDGILRHIQREHKGWKPSK